MPSLHPVLWTKGTVLTPQHLQAQDRYLDELLHAALIHERRHPPSLQGFLHWLRQGGAEVKREAEAAGAGGGFVAMGPRGFFVATPDTQLGSRLPRGGQ